jgi:hypothetical protein
MEFIPKIVLTIYLEGRTLVRQSEPEKYVFTKKNGRKKVVKHYPKTVIPASQKITMPIEAWKEFTAEDNCPRWEKPYDWKRMTKKKRAESHLKQICNSLQGKYFTYEILND